MPFKNFKKMALLPHNKSPLLVSGVFFRPYSLTSLHPITHIENPIKYNEKPQIFVLNSGIFRRLVMCFLGVEGIFNLLFGRAFLRKTPASP